MPETARDHVWSDCRSAIANPRENVAMNRAAFGCCTSTSMDSANPCHIRVRPICSLRNAVASVIPFSAAAFGSWTLHVGAAVLVGSVEPVMMMSPGIHLEGLLRRLRVRLQLATCAARET